MSIFKDAGPLDERITEAIRRITHGNGSMRIPAEATDPDIVLVDCRAEIRRLTGELEAAEQHVLILSRRAPAPSDKYEARVGDVVRHVDDGECVVIEPANHKSVATHLRTIDGKRTIYGYLDDARFWTYIRKAAPDELRAAGLEARQTQDDRRVVGAVVRYLHGEYVVVKDGLGDCVQRVLSLGADREPTESAENGDVFQRWATPAECARHGIPYVDRSAAPAPGVEGDEAFAAKVRAWYESSPLFADACAKSRAS